MTAIVLLDLRNEYQDFENTFRPQLLSHFITKPECLAYIASRLANIRLLHFFIPESEHIEIGADIVLMKIIYYIYCQDDASMNQMRHQYNTPMYVKIFHVESLSTYLRQAAITHLIEQAERTIHEPDEHDIALQAAAELSDTLANELYEHMNDMVGSQPED